MGPRREDRKGVRFMHLGDQCPYTRWFAGEARGLARELGMDFAETDVTGRPDLTAPLGAYHAIQVHIPGYPLLGAPRATATMLSMIEKGLAEQPAQTVAVPTRPGPNRSPAPPPGSVCILRPQDRGWQAAVAGSVAVCLGASLDSRQRQTVAEAKSHWLEGLGATYGVQPVLAVVRLAGQMAGFAEMIPVRASHIPIAGASPADMFLTCVHAAPDIGELRPALIRAAQEAVADQPASGPAVWAVSGRLCPYPNGPLDIFTAAGFAAAAGLGRVYLAQWGWDDLLLVRWSSGAGRGAIVGLLLSADDNVATLPAGCERGQVIELGGSAAGSQRSVEAGEAIPEGHKLAVHDIPAGRAVVKYGQPIGLATRAIRRGEHVHVHNLASDRAQGWGRRR
ncbi:MAG: UxaA family hydrolase [Bacillota bacterium]|nr:UxaA family hydrolase [Bacillota bacterium]